MRHLGGARRIGVLPSGVSRTIKGLEKRLGVALLARGPRHFRPTAEGEVLYERGCRLLADLDEMEQAVSDRGRPKGRLRVSMSVAFGRIVILPLLARFRELYPDIGLQLSFTDRYADVQRGAADVALRFGPLPDSDLTARRLARSPRIIVASPTYVAARGRPTSPADLISHDCVRLSGEAGMRWPFLIDGVATSIEAGGAIEVDDGESLAELALAGHGIARVGRFHVRDAIEQGRLVELLSSFRTDDADEVYAVFPGGRSAPARVRVFVDYLVEAVDKRILE